MTRREVLKAEISKRLVAYMTREGCAGCGEVDGHPAHLRVECRGGDHDLRIEVRACDSGQQTKAGNSWATDEVLDLIVDAVLPEGPA